MRKVVLCLVTFMGCTAVQVAGDKSRTVVGIYMLDGEVPKDSVVVCRLKEGQSEWPCLRMESLQAEMAAKADGGVK